jgi:methionine-S-sulfoxide reductase
VGYTGGEAPNATYLDHGTHAEATEIVFDPSELSYRRLLEFFFQIHDPTTRNRQANDAGASYRSAISYSNEPQRSEAERGFRNQTFWKATRRRIRYKYALRAGTTTLTRVPCASLV